MRTEPAPVNGPPLADAVCDTASGGAASFRRDIRGSDGIAPRGAKSGACAVRGVSVPYSGPEKPSEFFPPLKSCSKCGEAKPRSLDNFPSDSRRRDGLRAECRLCFSAIRLAAYARRKGDEYRPSPTRRKPKTSKVGAYKIDDRERARASARKSGRGPADRLRERIRQAIGPRAQGHYSLGCTPSELKRHLERQFAKGMSWENREQWHVDHIRPLASFDLNDPEQLRAACHFTNLRPIWAEENMRKGAKLEMLL